MTTTTHAAAAAGTPAGAAIERRTGRATPGWSDVMAGARAMLPMLAGIVPLGLAVGVTIADSDTSHAAAWATSPLIYAASAQVAVVGLLDQHAALPVLLAVVALVNLRLGLYGVALAQRWRGLPLGRRLLFSYLLVDPSFYVAEGGYAANPSLRAGHRHYFGGAVLLWFAWIGATAAGAAAGTLVPAGLHLEAVSPLYLLAYVAQRLRDSALRLPALVAVVAAVAGTRLPLATGLPAAMLAALVTADTAHRLRQRRGAR